MIKRYDVAEISKIWADENKYAKMLEVELAILEALEDKMVPKGTAAEIRAKAEIRPDRVDEIEKVTKHDIIAFCTSIAEQFTAETGKFFHFGVTSSDIIDSALSLQIRESMEYVVRDLESLCDSLLAKAQETKEIITMGRSHGMFAEPMSFGQKFLGAYVEFKRRLKDLKEFQKDGLTVQFSGAVGNYCILTTEDEKKAADILGLPVEEVSTQVIPRDRIAKLISIHGLIASAIERLAVEIRHLHRSDVFEVYEGFSKGQKGSSTMPHKKNPISTENLTGMARMLRSHVSIALENCVLWHERDISHSSAERFYLPDNFGIMVYALRRMKNTIDNLVVQKDIIEDRVRSTSAYLSSFYLHFLVANTPFMREDCYKIVQQVAFDLKQDESFSKNLQKVMQDEHSIILDVPEMDFEGIKKTYLKEIDHVFARSIKV
ncbi:adenylosuccinate lyase [Francisella philomiragia]|uniref:adenylosuccinate lyase n=1 Tax=Francisella philomiragia TaxID=28110 RepID=UPI001907AC19|nr:adenylosuccinate lyase [Francisella philomiragia]MBK2267182.1 adenylosuccinate lyase [Francisella philomiragia]MBK2278805.1 adenylosuccinate lyase [Francisella philomiragia]MBK2286659.1 adenylosuccinate lyase [Francisella philomiragia]MBK2288467.1 adenylosuccinate lyase [Francisella philomiragia]MBK2290188.1 adenylosuccinate lyase [Francisella philomiragia]